MAISLIDAHCHLDFPVFDGKRSAVFTGMGDAGVDRIVIPGVRRPDWQRVLDIAALDSRLSPCLGIHPWYVSEHSEDDVSLLDDWLQRNPQCVALGECGLDRIYGDLDEQLPLFESQVELACRRDWPLVIHSVRTHEPVMEVLNRHGVQAAAMIHAFAGSPEQATQLTRKGIYLGVGGVITYGRARKTRQAIAEAPLESLILETDAPDMPPEGVEKGTNSPLNLGRVFDALCGLRDEAPDDIAEALTRNVRQFYRW